MEFTYQPTRPRVYNVNVPELETLAKPGLVPEYGSYGYVQLVSVLFVLKSIIELGDMFAPERTFNIKKMLLVNLTMSVKSPTNA